MPITKELNALAGIVKKIVARSADGLSRDDRALAHAILTKIQRGPSDGPNAAEMERLRDSLDTAQQEVSALRRGLDEQRDAMCGYEARLRDSQARNQQLLTELTNLQQDRMFRPISNDKKISVGIPHTRSTDQFGDSRVPYNKIEWIKKYRECFGTGLADAKFAVEKIVDTQTPQQVYANEGMMKMLIDKGFVVSEIQ